MPDLCMHFVHLYRLPLEMSGVKRCLQWERLEKPCCEALTADLMEKRDTLKFLTHAKIFAHLIQEALPAWEGQCALPKVGLSASSPGLLKSFSV